MRKLVLGFLATVGVYQASAAFGQATPDPASIRVDELSYNGPGCPLGSVASNVAPDAKALSVLFGEFVVDTGEGAGAYAQKACSVDIKLRVPPGWSYALLNAQVRGYASVSAGSVASETATYTFGRQDLLVAKKDFVGPFDANYQQNASVPINALSWSPCGGSGRNLGLTASLTARGARVLMTVDSIDGELTQSYGVQWRRCTGSGSDVGPSAVLPNPAQVRVFDMAAGRDQRWIQAYDANFRGGVRLALGDVNGDGVPDVITGAGAGGGPHVQVFDGRTGATLRSFFAYDPGFRGGVYVAAGDVNGDGKDEIITGPGPGGGPQVNVFDGATGQNLKSFFAYDLAFRGGVHVAAGAVTGTRTSQIITAPGPGGGPIVRIFDPAANYASIRDFNAYDPNFRGGVFVAAGDVNGDGAADIVTGAGPTGGPHVQVFDGRTGVSLMSFFAYDSRFTGGAQVSTVDLDGDGIAEIVTGAGSGGGPHVKVVNGRTGLSVPGWAGSFFAFHWTYTGGVSVAGYAPQRGRPFAPVLAFAPERPR